MKVRMCEIVTKVEYLNEKWLNNGLSQGAIKDYAYIIHHSDKKEDGSLKDMHYHICLRFKDSYDTKYIAKWFNVGEQFVSKVKGRWSDVLKYLTHANAPTKFQYSVDDVISNFDWKNEVSKSDGLKHYLDLIDSGEIREYNQFEKIPIDVWAKNKTVLTNALQYYKERIFMNKDREIKVMICTGNTGTGKTTFSKQYAKAMNKSICISSSSNDVMQDYKGEDILVLDDLRDDSFSFADLLKILDNHTKSTMKSRYSNKGFIGDTIIITSYKDIETWYPNIKDENKLQLYRRISTKFVFTDDVIMSYDWNNRKEAYEFTGRVKNIYKMKAKEKVKTGLDILKAMSSDEDLDKFDSAYDMLDNMTDEETEQLLLVDNEENPF